LFDRQLGERRAKIAQLQRGDRVRLNWQKWRNLFHPDGNALFAGPAYVVDVLVVEDREEPSPQIGPGLPKMLFGNGPHQAFLNQIVGDRRIPGQCVRVAPKSGDLLFEEFTEIAHNMRLFNYVPTIVAKQHASLPTCDSRPHFFAVRPIGAPFQRGRFMVNGAPGGSFSCGFGTA
jgi:hypothetical protein